jgi:hypothetical protein
VNEDKALPNCNKIRFVRRIGMKCSVGAGGITIESEDFRSGIETRE